MVGKSWHLINYLRGATKLQKDETQCWGQQEFFFCIFCSGGAFPVSGKPPQKEAARRENISWHENFGAQGSKASSILYFWPPLCSHIIRTWSKRPRRAPGSEVAAALGWHFQVHPNTQANYPCSVLGAAQVEQLLTALCRWGGCGIGLEHCKNHSQLQWELAKSMEQHCEEWFMVSISPYPQAASRHFLKLFSYSSWLQMQPCRWSCAALLCEAEQAA